MSSYRNLKGVAAAAAVVATIGISPMPARAAITHNALTSNALTAASGGSAIDDLNGVVLAAEVPIDCPDHGWVGPGTND
jgi:hypothetical protein